MSNIEFDIKAMTINQEKLQALADEAKKLADRLCTKEGLIARQRHLLRSVIGFPIFFAKGEFEKARELVIAEAGREWENDFLRGFDLKLVSEQGAMLREGSVPMRACGPAAVFRWAAGELFADVAARGAAAVRDAVKEHLAPKANKEISGTWTTQWAPDATATNYYFGASSIRGVVPLYFDDNGSTRQKPPRETCGSCGDCFIPSAFGATKYTDGSGQVVSICERCLPQMTPDYKIINGRLVKTLPMPDEIRRGMAFYDGRAVRVVSGYDGPRPRRGDEPACWSTDRYWFFPSDGHFLGCDPAHASPEDCARYGIAPGFEVKR